MKTTLILVSILTIGFVVGVNSGKVCGNKPADVVFVLDGSTSIHSTDFKLQLKFVQNLTDTFDVHFNRTHVGVLTFASDVRIVFPLRRYTEETELKKAINEIQQLRGQTYTHLALQRLREEMFAKEIARSWVPHVAIVITDGDSDYHEKTKVEADLVHEAGIDVYAIGVGHSISMEELRTIASEPDMAHTVKDYAALDSLRDILASKDCPVPTTIPPSTTTTTEAPAIEGCNSHKQFDLTWSISSQAGVEETRLSIDFIKSLTQDMTIDPHHVQVGLTPRYCDESEGIRLKDHDTRSGFIEELDKRQIPGLRQTHQVIDYIRNDYAGRPGAVKYGILVVDNRLENWEQALDVARKAKKEGIRLIAIGVGDRVQQDQLPQLSWSDKSYFSVRSYSALADFKSQLIQTICEGITERQSKIRSLREYLEQF